MTIEPVAQASASAVADKSAVKPATKEATESKPVTKETTESKPQPTVTDTVQISSAAKAALQELTETAFQTAREARSGDLQAMHLQARQAAAEEAKESSAMRAQEAQTSSVE